MVKILLNNKADINKCAETRVTPLIVACGKQHIEIVKILLDSEADIHACKCVPFIDGKIYV